MGVKDLATSQLLQILADHPMEPGARLKQRLNAALVEKGLGPFDQKTVGFKTFKDYLKSLGSLLSIQERPGSDIRVSLGEATPSQAITTVTPVSLRSDIWLAFSDPDANRVRFYDKSSGKVVDLPASGHAAIANAEQSGLIAIPAISAAHQKAWMENFLVQNSLSEDVSLKAVVDTPYNRSVSTAFARVLGKNGAAWRKFRANRVFAEASTWAARHAINPELLQGGAGNVLATAAGQALPPRMRAVKLLESFSDQELIETVIPILAATILVKSRA